MRTRDERGLDSEKTEHRFLDGEQIHDLLLFIPPLLLIGIVLGSLYTGLTTPTEAAGFGAIGALILAILSGRMTLKKFTIIMSATARTSSMILFLITDGNCHISHTFLTPT